MKRKAHLVKPRETVKVTPLQVACGDCGLVLSAVRLDELQRGCHDHMVGVHGVDPLQPLPRVIQELGVVS